MTWHQEGGPVGYVDTMHRRAWTIFHEEWQAAGGEARGVIPWRFDGVEFTGGGYRLKRLR